MADPIDKLTAAMAAGEASAVETFYRRYFDSLYAHARRATRRDEAFCLDVVQDAVLRIVRTVRRTDSEAQFHTWLRLVVQTTALDRLRSESRQRKRETTALAMRATESNDELDGEMVADELRSQIERLDPEIARMIRLRYEERWTLTRIAGLLGLSIGTIDGRLRRALRELKGRMTQADYD